VLLQADATGGDGFVEEAHDDPYNNFFQVKLLFSCSSTGTNKSACSLRSNLFHHHHHHHRHRHRLASVSPHFFRLATSGVSSLDVTHHQTNLSHKNAPSMNSSVVALAQTCPKSSLIKKPNLILQHLQVHVQMHSSAGCLHSSALNLTLMSKLNTHNVQAVFLWSKWLQCETSRCVSFVQLQSPWFNDFCSGFVCCAGAKIQGSKT
jgi:hypothetical protein